MQTLPPRPQVRPRRVAVLLACLTAFLAAAPAVADERGRRERGIELFTEFGFEGESRYFPGPQWNLSEAGFNDRPMSVRLLGPGGWQLCDNAGFGGRCVFVNRDEPDLRRLGMAGRVSSFRRVEDIPPPPAPPPTTTQPSPGDRHRYDAAPGEDPSRTFSEATPGRTSVFFPRPMLEGRPAPACSEAGCGTPAADAFCRSEGLRRAAYHSIRRNRGLETLDDVLCLR